MRYVWSDAQVMYMYIYIYIYNRVSPGPPRGRWHLGPLLGPAYLLSVNIYIYIYICIAAYSTDHTMQSSFGDFNWKPRVTRTAYFYISTTQNTDVVTEIAQAVLELASSTIADTFTDTFHQTPTQSRFIGGNVHYVTGGLAQNISEQTRTKIFRRKHDQSYKQTREIQVLSNFLSNELQIGLETESHNNLYRRADNLHASFTTRFTEGLTNRQTDRQTDRQTYRHTYIPTDR